MVTSADAVEVTAPRANDKRTDPDGGQRMRFSSAILAPWARKTPQISEVLPLQYLHGLSSGDFVPALAQFVGACTGLSAPVITKLTQTWQAEASAFMTRDLFGVHYVYLWVDGIHLGIRLGEGKLWLLVMIGVRADGCVELIGHADGCRESAESWADLLRDCARRGMRAPVLAVGALKAKRKGGQAQPTPRPRRSVVCRGHRCWRHRPDRTAVSWSRRRHAGSARRREARRKAHGSRARHHGLASGWWPVRRRPRRTRRLSKWPVPAELALDLRDPGIVTG